MCSRADDPTQHDPPPCGACHHPAHWRACRAPACYCRRRGPSPDPIPAMMPYAAEPMRPQLAALRDRLHRRRAAQEERNAERYTEALAGARAMLERTARLDRIAAAYPAAAAELAAGTSAA